MEIISDFIQIYPLFTENIRNHVFFAFYVFLYIIMYTINIAKAIKTKSVNEIRYFTPEKYFK